MLTVGPYSSTEMMCGTVIYFNITILFVEKFWWLLNDSNITICYHQHSNKVRWWWRWCCSNIEYGSMAQRKLCGICFLCTRQWLEHNNLDTFYFMWPPSLYLYHFSFTNFSVYSCSISCAHNIHRVLGKTHQNWLAMEKKLYAQN